MSETVTHAVHARIAWLHERCASIHGWLDPNAALALYDLARRLCPTDCAVELGSWKGLSAIWLAAGLADRGYGRLVAVDTWAGTATEADHGELLRGYGPDQLYQEFLANVARCGLADRVEALRTTTRDAALAWRRGPCIGLLHIDAGHEYADVREDFELWSPLVVEGGYVVFDDVPSWRGPSRLVGELPPWWRAFAAPPNKWIVQRVP